VQVEGVHRPAHAEISASAIAHNVRAIKSVIGDSAFCAVVKANGYGHGAELAAKSALVGGADMLAVAIIDEGIELRASGITAPILLLAEVPADTLTAALENSLTLTIGSLEGARAAVAVAESLGGRHRVHVKVDTGMHRMGVAPQHLEGVVDVLNQSAAIDLEGLYTHFSVADGSSAEDRAFTREQIAQFDEVVASLKQRGVEPRIVHAANSAGALGYPEARHTMVRVGLSLYGYLPEAWLASALEASGERLLPAMTLRARVVAVRRAAAGERPSYKRRRALDAAATIATVPFGYADGYPRRLFDAGAEVLINGKRYPLAGVVTMDMLVIDCGDDAVAPGDEVVLLGRQGDEEITADEWAERAGTISWEILCGIGARVPRILVD
jgi:alanine racemase